MIIRVAAHKHMRTLQEEFGIGNLESFKSAIVLSGGGAAGAKPVVH
jgi:hypothetical protein